MTICRLFHGTDAAFDRFDLCFAVQEDRHENGALGIWFETREVIAAHFGRHLITVDVDVSRWYEMTISELTRHALRKRICCLLRATPRSAEGAGLPGHLFGRTER